MLGPARLAAQATDRDVHVPVNYFTLVPPPAGQSYIDPVFGTVVRRISDARNQPDAADTGNLGLIVNEYSTMSPFNQDDSRLLLQHQSYFALYDGQGRYQHDLPFEISAGSEPRWSRKRPELLYYLSGNGLKSYDASTGLRAVVHQFAEYTGVSGRYESDICFDGDHFVLVGDGHDIFVYELSTDRKGPVLDATGHGFDSVYIAPGDQVIVSWYAIGTDRYTGIELYDRDMAFQRQLATVGGHMDVGRDTNGEPVLLWSNSGMAQPPVDCQNAVVKIRLADAHQTCLLSLDWGLAAHVSVPDGGDWFYLSTYVPDDPNPLLGGWRRYAGEILQVRLDGSEVRRLVHHRSRPFNDYWYTPRAAVSRDGTRLVYSSNYGLSSILGGPSYVDAYLVSVGGADVSSLGSHSAVTTRFEQDHPSVAYAGTWYPNTMSLHSQGSAVLSVEGGAHATFSFSGWRVCLVGYRDEWSGIARVSLDGALQATVDTYRTPFQAQSTLFSATQLAPGRHTLDVEVTGTRNAAAGSAWVWIDAFEATTRTEEDDAAVSYTGAWFADGLPVHSGQRAMKAMDAGARASFHFSGTVVSWIGYRDVHSGIATVSIDGAARAELDTYTPVAQPQAVVYTLSGLAAGDHTLDIGVAGRHHPLALGDWVWIDAFETPSGWP